MLGVEAMHSVEITFLVFDSIESYSFSFLPPANWSGQTELNRHSLRHWFTAS